MTKAEMITEQLAQARLARREASAKLAAEKVAARELAKQQREAAAAAVEALKTADCASESTMIRRAAKLAVREAKAKALVELRETREKRREDAAKAASEVTAKREQARTLQAEVDALEQARISAIKASKPVINRPTINRPVTHTTDELGNRHKIDTPNTLKAREAAIQLAREIAYNEFAYYPQDTLFLQLPDHTKIFVTNGTGTVSKARAELEEISNAKDYPDYEVVSSYIYKAYMLMQTARQKDKSEITFVLNYTEYTDFITSTAIVAVETKNIMACIWCVMAATGCRANEIAGEWRLHDGTYVSFTSPKVPSASGNLVLPIIQVSLLKQLREVLKELTSADIKGYISREHKYFITQYTPLINLPPRFTRDIYQCIAYNSLLEYGLVSAVQFANYVGYRSTNSSAFICYTALQLSPKVTLPAFVELAKKLKFI